MEYVLLYKLSVGLSCIALLFLLTLVWRRHHVPGGMPLVGMIVATLIWCLFSFWETSATTLEAQQIFFKLEYTGLMLVPPAWLIFTVNYTTDSNFLSGIRLIPILIIPLCVIAVVWNPAWYSTMYSLNDRLVMSGPFLIIERDWTWTFWFTVIHNYVLMFLGSAVIVWRMLIQSRVYKTQAFLLLLAIALPLISNIVFVFDVNPLVRKDFSPVTFTISALLFVLGLMRYNLFMIVPFAQQFFFSHIKDAILVFDGQNKLIEANTAAKEMFSVSKRDFGKDAAELAMMPRVFPGMIDDSSGIVEIPLIVSGQERYFEIESISMKNGSVHRVGSMVTLHDITERKNLQDQISAQDRLVSIGQLTAGVAHEINNPLAIIKGLTELLLDSDVDDTVREDVTTISEEVDRATAIVGNLLTFARKQHGEKRPIDVNEIIQKTIALRRYELSCSNIQTVLNLSPGLPYIMGNPIQIRQVITNIIINAEYFLIEYRNQGTIRISTRIKDDVVYIRIKDDGPGIAQDDINRIFDPFFTTKQIGQGTGLGLSVCHGIITEHGGDIKVDSKPGEGTEFIITLPAFDS